MMKRLLDILVSLMALSVLALPFLVIIVVLRFTGEGDVWYLQERVGFGGKRFRVFKFVTMRVGSEFSGNKDITVRDDPRVLPVGRVLRMTKLNELPQVLNVLLGHMSLVGWRPLVPRGFEDYPEHVQEGIVQSKPGITGIGSIIFRDEEAITTNAHKDGMDLRECYREHILPYKGEVELWYRDHQSFALDLKILWLTAKVVLVPGAGSPLRHFPGLPQPESAVLRKHLGLEDGPDDPAQADATTDPGPEAATNAPS